MRQQKDGVSQIVVPNRPETVARGQFVTARVWVNFLTPLTYELVADFYRHSDREKTYSVNERELEDVIKQGTRVLAYIRKDKRRKLWASFLSNLF
jgi:hypothetical protein